MRTGMNPLATTTLPPLPERIAAVITHLPNREGYHAKRFEVIQASLTSLISGAGSDLPLYIWDNGSDAEFRQWLVNDLRPEFLTLSPNIGKASARTMILRSLPLQTVVCMSDDDIHFEPGWLDAQVELLTGFPGVGAVSGCPIRTQFRWAIDSTLKWARANAKLKQGRFIPAEWELDFCVSIGREYLHHLRDTEKDVDYLIEYKGLRAYATAHHMQFICYAGKLDRIGQWVPGAMRNEIPFDLAVDKLGLLRLTTTERYTRHLGNVLDA